MKALLLILALVSADPRAFYRNQECISPGGGSFGGDVTMKDDIDLCFGTTCFWWDVYNSTSTQWEKWHTDCDLGGGTDCEVIICDNGGNDCVFSGVWTATDGLSINADNAKLTLGAAAATDSYLVFDGINLVAYSSGSVVFNASPEVGTFEVYADSGAVNLIDMQVSDTPAAGTEESYTFSIDSSSDAFLKIYAEADSSGGIQNFDLVVPPYDVDYVINAAGATLGPTGPTEGLVNGSCAGRGFDAAGEIVILSFEIPSCWAAGAADDITLKVYWCPTASDTPAENEDVDWEISYRVLDWGTDATTTGSAVIANGNWIAGASEADTKTYVTNITIDADHADQPLVAGEVISITFNRDTANESSSYSGNAIVQLFEISVPQTSLLCDHQN